MLGVVPEPTHLSQIPIHFEDSVSHHLLGRESFEKVLEGAECGSKGVGGVGGAAHGGRVTGQERGQGERTMKDHPHGFAFVAEGNGIRGMMGSGSGVVVVVTDATVVVPHVRLLLQLLLLSLLFHYSLAGGFPIVVGLRYFPAREKSCRCHSSSSLSLLS